MIWLYIILIPIAYLLVVLFIAKFIGYGMKPPPWEDDESWDYEK